MRRAFVLWLIDLAYRHSREEWGGRDKLAEASCTMQRTAKEPTTNA